MLLLEGRRICWVIATFPKHTRSVENCRQSEDVVYAELLNRIRIGSHSSDDLEVLSKRVCGTGHPFNRECTITENATVLCSKHEYKDVVNEQLSTLPSEVVECHASDTDCSGAPLNKFQIIKLNQSKSAPPEVLKLKCGARVVITRCSGWCCQWYYWNHRKYSTQFNHCSTS
jgi:hypothetical protein